MIIQRRFSGWHVVGLKEWLGFFGCYCWYFLFCLMISFSIGDGLESFLCRPLLWTFEFEYIISGKCSESNRQIDESIANIPNNHHSCSLILSEGTGWDVIIIIITLLIVKL